MIFYGNSRAFTLIEIMLVIGVMSLVALSISSFDVRSVNDRQKLEVFSNNIRNVFENTRNNSLLGKGIGPNVLTPSKWKININSLGLQTYYDIGAGDENFADENLIIDTSTPNILEIIDFKCFQLDTSITPVIPFIDVEIEFTGDLIRLKGGCSSDELKILQFTTRYKGITNTITINTVNGLIDIKK